MSHKNLRFSCNSVDPVPFLYIFLDPVQVLADPGVHARPTHAAAPNSPRHDPDDLGPLVLPVVDERSAGVSAAGVHRSVLNAGAEERALRDGLRRLGLPVPLHALVVGDDGEGRVVELLREGAVLPLPSPPGQGSDGSE